MQFVTDIKTSLKNDGIYLVDKNYQLPRKPINQLIIASQDIKANSIALHYLTGKRYAFTDFKWMHF